MADPQQAPPVKFYRRREFIISTIFICLVFLILLSSRITGRPPLIEQISPRIGVPGEVMVIQGRFFGRARDGGGVRIGGYSPISSAYLEWKDNRISLHIPDDAGSGIIQVVTKRGRSNGVLFTNREEIPRVVSGPAEPGAPYIRELNTRSNTVGSLLTIHGLDFGLSRGNSQVYFTWIGGDTQGKVGGSDLSPLVPAQEIDLDYESWSDREIQVRVPDGASSGQLLVMTDKGRSNAVYFEVENPAGSKQFPEKRTYSIQYAVHVRNVASAPDNSLYLWVPQIIPGPEQREIQLVAQEPEPLFEDVNGTKLFQLRNLISGQEYRVVQHVMVDRYSIQTKINSAGLPRRYDTDTRLYRKYTAPDFIVPSAHPRIKGLGSSIIQGIRTPYYQAQAIFNWVLARLSVAEDAPPDVLQAIESRKGGSFDYAVLFCALCRSVGIPARPVAGYLVDDTRQVFRHYWAEFYLEGIGWIPADPLLAEGGKWIGLHPADFRPQEYYFGNLDAGHITFSKGVIPLNRMQPEGRALRRIDVPSLQSVHEEAAGNLYGYSAAWADIHVLGIY